MAISKFDGWVGETLLRVGDEYADDHPLVTGRPEMFEVEQEPEPSEMLQAVKTQEGVKYEPSAPVARKKPGPKPGSSRTKPQT